MIDLRQRAGRRTVWPALFLALICGAARVDALDIFTLWRQPEIPLRLAVGDWVDYRTVTWVGGRRSEDLVRIQCIDKVGATERPSWVIEMLPLTETKTGLQPHREGALLLQLSDRLLQREGDLVDIIEKVVRWQDGLPEELEPDQWRRDPLVASSLKTEFQPERAERVGNSTRVVGGRELLCDQFEMFASDTVSVVLPRGRLQQISTWEVTAETSAEVPFLGILFAAERTKSHSLLDPPSERFPLPAPVTEVETMELVGFGAQARPFLSDR